MASAGVAPSGYKDSTSTSIGVEKLQDQMNEIKIRDDKEVEATIINGKGTETGHIIVTTTGGKNGQPKQGSTKPSRMPLGKYYCDYCDKQFQDTPAARRRHLQGVQHQRARALWYDSIRHQEQHGGASSFLLPDGTLAKGICHHFVRTGACKYGDSCRYFHPKPDGVNPALAAPGPGSGPGPMVQQSDFIGNQPNFVGYQGADRNSSSGNILGGHTSWGNLPPSLQPPPEGGYPPLPFIDWG